MHAIKEYGRVEMYLHQLLTSALDGCEWSVHITATSNPAKKLFVPITDEDGYDLAGRQDILAKRKISCLFRNRAIIPLQSGPQHSMQTAILASKAQLIKSTLITLRNANINLAVPE
jgi:hypothetical protein